MNEKLNKINYYYNVYKNINNKNNCIINTSRKNLIKNGKNLFDIKNRIRNKKKFKKHLSKFWYYKFNKYSHNFLKFKSNRIALKPSNISTLKLYNNNEDNRNLFKISYLHKKNFHNASKIISMSNKCDEQHIIIDSFKNNYKTKNNCILINNEFDRNRTNCNHDLINKSFNYNFNERNINEIINNNDNKCHNSYYLNIKSQRPVHFFNNNMNNQNDLKLNNTYVTKNIAYSNTLIKNDYFVCTNSCNKLNENTKKFQINNNYKINYGKYIQNGKNLYNFNLKSNINDKNHKINKSEIINIKCLCRKNLIINSMKCALNNIKNFLFINFKTSKYNYKYQIYLSFLIIQLLMTTQCVLGYNNNISSQTIQQHHYFTSSSSSNLAASTSIRTQSLSSSPLLSSSSSTSLSATASASSSLAAAAAAAAATAISAASGDSTIHLLKNQHSTSTILQHRSGGITDNLNSESSNINNYEFIGRENLIRREPNLSYTSNGCHTCQMREQAKADNLASIKKHILMRLKLDSMPNITSPVVPREIIEKFYKNNSNMFNKNNHNYNNGNGGGENNNRSGSEQIYKNHNIRNSDTNHHIRRMINSQRSFDGMQGDDPRMYGNEGDNNDYNVNNEEDNGNEEYEEEFYSIVNSLYVFPTVPRMRHNRKPEILHFSFTNNGHSTISQAILHIYIRGRDWIHEYEPSILNDKTDSNRRDIVITINRVLRRQNSPNSTHTQKVNELRQLIPNGIGSWIQIDVTDMVSGWYNNPSTNFGVVIKTTETWMKNLVVIDDSSGSKPIYIEILTKDNRKRRSKRNTSLNCSESDNEVRCCRYPLEVDFRKFNWDWIIAPTSFNAYFCNGECKLGFLQRYPHTHIMQLSTAPQPCCSPTKMSPISLLYFNNEQTLVMSTIPNMAVDKCSCS